MPNGKLETPNLDDRTWEMLVTEARKKIPDYTKEWTDHNPSDPGIVLIELFAWLMEQTIYRLNRVPDKYRREFLNLVGITRQPPNPAQADITFTLGGEAPVTIPKRTQLSTPAQGTRDGIIFETDKEFAAVNLKACLWLYKSQDRLKYKNYSSQFLEDYRSVQLDVTRNVEKMLVLGIAAPTIAPLSFSFKIAPALKALEPAWKYSSTEKIDEWKQVLSNPASRFGFDKPGRVDFRVDSANGVTLWKAQKPSAWNAQPAENEVAVTEAFYWIGIDFKDAFKNRPSGDDATQIIIDRIAGNMISASNVQTVTSEFLGTSNGKPFQVFPLKKTPLFLENTAADPLNHLKIVVQKKDGGRETWTRVEEFSDKVANEYRCPPVTAEIKFGGLPKFGNIPPEGSQIFAETYRFVSDGSTGNVDAQTITVQRTVVPGVSAVTNEKAAQGGSDWEDEASTLRRGPQAIKNHDRAVTIEDFEQLALQASSGIAKVKCLGPKKASESEYFKIKYDSFEMDRSPGKAHVVIVPVARFSETEKDDKKFRQPAVAKSLRREVEAFLNARGMVTSELRLYDPKFVEIYVETKVWVPFGHDTNQVRKSIENALLRFLHPVDAGGKDWHIGEDLYIPDLVDLIRRLPSVSYVEALEAKTVEARPEPATSVRIKIDDHEIVCAAPSTLFKITVSPESEEL